eukprot:jgi/Mesen1/4424/ME000225S03413
MLQVRSFVKAGDGCLRLNLPGSQRRSLFNDSNLSEEKQLHVLFRTSPDWIGSIQSVVVQGTEDLNLTMLLTRPTAQLQQKLTQPETSWQPSLSFPSSLVSKIVGLGKEKSRTTLGLRSISSTFLGAPAKVSANLAQGSSRAHGSGRSMSSSASSLFGTDSFRAVLGCFAEEPLTADAGIGDKGNGGNARASAATAGAEPSDANEADLIVSRLSHLDSSFRRSQNGSTSPSLGTLEEQSSIYIHPLAVVHPDAILMQGVEIGPFCTVGPAVKLGPFCKLHPGSHVFGNTELGSNCTLMSGAIVGADLPGTTILGDNNSIGHHALVGTKCQDMKYKGSECFLVMGSGNDVREHVSIHRSSKADDQTAVSRIVFATISGKSKNILNVLGDDNLIMGSCHVAHDCKIGNRNILANGTLLAGHVLFEDFIHTGGAVAVHQFCHVGSFSFLAGGHTSASVRAETDPNGLSPPWLVLVMVAVVAALVAVVVRDVPMYTMVQGDRAELRGLNLEGMRRCGFSTDEEENELSTYPVVTKLLQSVRGSFEESRRGICRFKHWTSAD